VYTDCIYYIDLLLFSSQQGEVYEGLIYDNGIKVVWNIDLEKIP
jgi:hypothetical protein